MKNTNPSTFYDIFIKLKSDKKNALHFFSMNPASFMEKKRKSFAEIHRDIQICCNNLVKTGITDNATVGLNIDNSYFFFVCDFALILLGAVTLLHSKNDPVELLKERIDTFHIDYIVSEKNVPEIEGICPVIQLDALFDNSAAPVEIKAYELQHRDVSICFSSGTSGIPKALGASEYGSIETGKWFFKWMGFDSTDRFLVYLPLASYQQRFLMWGCLLKDVDIILVDDKTLFQGLQEFKPTILIAPPNFYFNLYRMNTGSRFKQMVREILPYNRKSKLLKFVAATYTYKPLYEALGGKTRYLITGMAPIDIKILGHFERGYVDIYQIYGQTEIGMIACNKIGANKLGTVGKPIIKIQLEEEDNEIITTSDFPTINSYYLENNKRVALGKRIPTGDIGHIDEDGYLTIKGRKNETLILKSGIKINPVLIETKIKAKTTIDEVVIFKPGEEDKKTGLHVALLVKFPAQPLEIDKIKEMIRNEHEIKQSSEKVSIFTYTVKEEDKKVMYTENNKFSRIRAIELLKNQTVD